MQYIIFDYIKAFLHTCRYMDGFPWNDRLFPQMLNVLKERFFRTKFKEQFLIPCVN